MVRPDTDFGKGTQTYNGIDITQQIRLKNGAVLSGGLSTDKQSTNTCFVVDSPGAMRFCDSTTPLLQYYTFTGFVPLPWGMVTGAVYRDLPGPQITATRNYTNAEIASIARPQPVERGKRYRQRAAGRTRHDVRHGANGSSISEFRRDCGLAARALRVTWTFPISSTARRLPR